MNRAIVSISASASTSLRRFSAISASMASTSPWWNSGVIYQVYIRSFADGNGDGTGDIAGLRSRLPYLKELGVDGLWINPWYKSPLADGGYDVTDYREIEAVYGNTYIGWQGS